jgi:hypothetical protein
VPTRPQPDSAASSLPFPRVLFPHRGASGSRPVDRWRPTGAWRLLLLAVAVAWLVGFLWPDLSATLRQ